jgi:hypothetical protein
VTGRRAHRWRKFPDVPLGVYVAGGLARRERKGISAPETEQARIGKVCRSTVLDGTSARRKWR